MIYICVSFFSGHWVSWDGLGHLSSTCRVAWIQPESSIIEVGEFFQEPARIEDVAKAHK